VRKERREAERPRRRRRTNPRDEVRQRSIDYKGAKAAEEIAELLAVHDVGVLAAGHVLVLLGWMSGKGTVNSTVASKGCNLGGSAHSRGPS
jgi:hypothetical protein